MQAGVIIWTGETCTCTALPSKSPQSFYACKLTSSAVQISSPPIANLGAPVSLLGCNKQVIVYLLEALLQHKALMKLLVNLLKSEGIIWVSCKCKENDPGGSKAPQLYEVPYSRPFSCYLWDLQQFKSLERNQLQHVALCNWDKMK